MGQILVRNIDDDVVTALKSRAEREHKSLEQTVRDVLTEATLRSREDVLREIDEFRARGPAMSTVNSADLIRQDRDNDEQYR